MRIRIQAVSCNADPHAYPDHWFSFPSLKLIQILTQVRGCLRSSGLTLATLFGVIGGVVFGLALRQRPEPWTDRWVSIFFHQWTDRWHSIFLSAASSLVWNSANERSHWPTVDLAFFYWRRCIGLELHQGAEPLTDRWLSILLLAASSLVWNSANERSHWPTVDSAFFIGGVVFGLKLRQRPGSRAIDQQVTQHFFLKELVGAFFVLFRFWDPFWSEKQKGKGNNILFKKIKYTADWKFDCC